jgi:hypothetical protein
MVMLAAAIVACSSDDGVRSQEEPQRFLFEHDVLAVDAPIEQIRANPQPTGLPIEEQFLPETFYLPIELYADHATLRAMDDASLDTITRIKDWADATLRSPGADLASLKNACESRHDGTWIRADTSEIAIEQELWVAEFCNDFLDDPQDLTAKQWAWRIEETFGRAIEVDER